MINPINPEYKAVIVDSISVKELKQAYLGQFDVDVSRYFDGLDKIDIYQCLNTKYRFFYPFEIIGDAEFYENLSLSKKDYYHSRWEHKLALHYANEGAKWLEIGSGDSYFLNKLRINGAIGTGLELNQIEGEKAKKNGLNVISEDFFIFENNGEKYDVICLFQVLEHISDVSEFFKKVISLLKPNGKLIFSVPNSNPYLYYYDKYHTLNLPPHHMGLWNKQSIELVGRDFGFIIKEISVEKLYSKELNVVINNAINRGGEHNKFVYRILNKVLKNSPSFISNRLEFFLRKNVFEGRNLFAVLEKK